METKVCKFGGTSMANAVTIEQSASIIRADSTRRFVVVSAPGKRESRDTKVTDLLIDAYKSFQANKWLDLRAVSLRFDEIIKGLNIELDLKSEFDKIEREILDGADKQYLASRGEYLCAKVFATYLGYEFIDAVEIIRFNTKGALEPELTNELIRQRLSNCKNAVIGGFYGADTSGKVRVFSRGGSDVTGSLIARGAEAKVYENFTDISGFRVCDPKIVHEPNKMEILSYKELRELCYMGAVVLHPDSIFPIRKAGIPINIKNTFEPENLGTLIVPTQKLLNGEYSRPKSLVTGIAGKKDFISVNIEKSMLNNETGIIRRLLEIFERYAVPFEHMPTGIDTISVIIDSNNIETSSIPMIADEIQRDIEPDNLEIISGIALISVVGHGMANHVGVAKLIFDALAQQSISIKMINLGYSEINCIIGIKNEDFDKSMRALYHTFFG